MTSFLQNLQCIFENRSSIAASTLFSCCYKANEPQFALLSAHFVIAYFPCNMKSDANIGVPKDERHRSWSLSFHFIDSPRGQQLWQGVTHLACREFTKPMLPTRLGGRCLHFLSKWSVAGWIEFWYSCIHHSGVHSCLARPSSQNVTRYTTLNAKRNYSFACIAELQLWHRWAILIFKFFWSSIWYNLCACSCAEFY